MRNRWWILGTVLLADLSFGTTTTILGASLSEVARGLDSTETAVSWGITGPFLAVGIGNPIMGKIGDTMGHRRVFRVGVVVFGTSTLLAGLSPNVATFVALRTLAGVGASAAIPTGLALILHEFSERERAKALGWVTMVNTGAPAIGLALGGVLIDTFGWRFIFVVYALVTAAGFLLSLITLRAVPRPSEPARIDVAGATALTVTVLAVMLGLYLGDELGFGHGIPLALFALAPVSLAGLVGIERRAPEPLVPLRYLRDRNFAAPMAASFFSNIAYMGGLVTTPILLEDVFGFSLATLAPLLLLRPGTFSLSAPLGGFLAGSWGERPAALTGMWVMAASMTAYVVGSRLEVLPLILLALILSGMAFGIASPSLNSSVANTADDDDLGVAGGMIGMTGSLGTVVGLQVFLLALGDDDVRAPAAFTAPFAIGIVAAAVAIASASAMTRHQRWAGADALPGTPVPGRAGS